MKTLKYLITLSLLVWSFNALAQDGLTDSHSVSITIPEVALLDLEATGSTSVSLTATAPTEAGESLVFPQTDNSIWLNYSSIVNGSTDASRNVTVAITTGTVPAGTTLSVVAATANTDTGDGTKGSPTSAVTLSSSAQNVITDIGSAYTGSGVSKGHNLTYTLGLSSESGSYANLDAANSSSVTITYTLSDN